MGHGAQSRTRWPRLVTAGVAALAVLAVPSAAQAGGSILSVSPHHLKFGRQPFGSFTHAHGDDPQPVVAHAVRDDH